MTDRTRPDRMGPRRFTGIDGAVFAAVALSGVPVNLGSELLLGEVLLVLFLPILVTRSPVDRFSRIVIALGVVWVSFVVIGGIDNDAAPVATVAAAVVAGLLVLDVLAIVLYTRLRGRAGWITLGLAFAVCFLLYARSQPTEFFEAAPWKFGFGLPITLLVVAVCSWKVKNRFVQAGVLAALSLVHILGNYRSGAGITLAVALLLLLFRSTRISGIAARIGLLVVAVVSVGAVYGTAVDSGLLGDTAQTRLSNQVGDDPTTFRLILGARKETALSVAIGADSPVFGVGPEPEVTQSAFEAWTGFYAANGLPLTSDDLSVRGPGELFHAHSALFAGWIEGGLGGFVFFGFALCRVLWVLLNGRASRAGPVVLFFVASALYNSVFSPIGGPYRLLFATGLAVVPFLSIRRDDAADEADPSGADGPATEVVPVSSPEHRRPQLPAPRGRGARHAPRGSRPDTRRTPHPTRPREVARGIR